MIRLCVDLGLPDIDFDEDKINLSLPTISNNLMINTVTITFNYLKALLKDFVYRNIYLRYVGTDFNKKAYFDIILINTDEKLELVKNGSAPTFKGFMSFEGLLELDSSATRGNTILSSIEIPQYVSDNSTWLMKFNTVKNMVLVAPIQVDYTIAKKEEENKNMDGVLNIYVAGMKWSPRNHCCKPSDNLRRFESNRESGNLDIGILSFYSTLKRLLDLDDVRVKFLYIEKDGITLQATSGYAFREDMVDMFNITISDKSEEFDLDQTTILKLLGSHIRSVSKGDNHVELICYKLKDI